MFGFVCERSAQQAGAGDGGLGVLFVSFSIVTSSGILAAPDLFRWTKQENAKA